MARRETTDAGTTGNEAAESADGRSGPGVARPGWVPPGDERVRIPPTATPQEAAAITAAVGSHIHDEQVRGEAPEPTWDGKRFAFAGRIAALTGVPRRVPDGAPTDDWTAFGRAERFKR